MTGRHRFYGQIHVSDIIGLTTGGPSSLITSFKGEFNASVQYAAGDIVTYMGETFIVPAKDNAGLFASVSEITGNSFKITFLPPPPGVAADFMYYDAAVSKTGTFEFTQLYPANPEASGFAPGDTYVVTGLNVATLPYANFEVRARLGGNLLMDLDLQKVVLLGGVDPVPDGRTREEPHMATDSPYIIPPENRGPWARLAKRGVNGTNGPVWRGPWDAQSAYDLNDLVSYNGSTYISISYPYGEVPDAPNSTSWMIVALRGAPGVAGTAGAAGALGPTGATGATGPAGAVGPAGLMWRGMWAAGTAYAKNDAVYYNGASYFASAPSTGVQPDTDTGTAWQPLAVRGATGATGPAGATGATGPAGATGTAGRGITSLALSGSNVLSVTYTDASTTTVGTINVTGANQVKGLWSASTSYVTGDVVGYQGRIYQASANIAAAGTFQTASWTALDGPPVPTPTAAGQLLTANGTTATSFAWAAAAKAVASITGTGSTLTVTYNDGSTGTITTSASSSDSTSPFFLMGA